ncbi:ABC transporter permease subunit, partial [Salmonella enterica subsp. enterica serovar Kentucky]|nr:ABC transporter permease subunit [Salmonella enterica subsp. enterica serovar Kentucky]
MQDISLPEPSTFLIRAAIQSLPRGQKNAALAMGLTLPQAYRYVLLPNAYRVIVPP